MEVNRIDPSPSVSIPWSGRANDLHFGIIIPPTPTPTHRPGVLGGFSASGQKHEFKIKFVPRTEQGIAIQRILIGFYNSSGACTIKRFMAVIYTFLE